MSNRQSPQSGIALIQAIVIAAILSIIALYLNSSARTNVSQTQLLSDRARAAVKLYDTEAEILFSVFTEELENGPTENGFFNWHFNGSLFKGRNNATISIQDEAGLLGLYPLRSTLLQQGIRKLGYSREISISVVNSLLDWQDTDSDKREAGGEQGDYNFGPRNKPMAEVQELNWIPQIPRKLRPELEKLLTVHTPKYFNPANAPEPLLKAYLDVDRLPSNINRFREGGLPNESFSDVAGVSLEEGINFATSSSLRITIHAKYGEASVAKQISIAIDRYNEDPERVLKVLGRFWGERALNYLYDKTNAIETDENNR